MTPILADVNVEALGIFAIVVGVTLAITICIHLIGISNRRTVVATK